MDGNDVNVWHGDDMAGNHPGQEQCSDGDRESYLIKLLETEIDHLHGLIYDQKGALMDKDFDNNYLERSLKRAKAKQRRREQALRVKDLEIQRLKKRLDAAIQIIEDRAVDSLDLLNLINEKSAEMILKDKEINNLRYINAKVEHSLEKAKDDVKVAVEAKKKAEDDLNKINAQMEYMKIAFAAKEEIRSGLLSSHQDLIKAEVEGYKAKIKEMGEAASESKADLVKEEQLNCVLSQDLVDKQEQIQQNEEEIKRLRGIIGK